MKQTNNKLSTGAPGEEPSLSASHGQTGAGGLTKKAEMKTIKPSPPSPPWPRHAVKSVECRKRDLVIRITDWMSDKNEPAYDVEIYIGGVYDFNESQSFTRFNADGPRKSPKVCKAQAIAYANVQIAKLL